MWLLYFDVLLPSFLPSFHWSVFLLSFSPFKTYLYLKYSEWCLGTRGGGGKKSENLCWLYNNKGPNKTKHKHDWSLTLKSFRLIKHVCYSAVGLSVWSKVISVNLTEMNNRGQGKTTTYKPPASQHKSSLNSGTTQSNYATSVQFHSTGEKCGQCHAGETQWKAWGEFVLWVTSWGQEALRLHWPNTPQDTHPYLNKETNIN